MGRTGGVAAIPFTADRDRGTSAHGYVSGPPSRQAQCAAGTVQCGEITFTWKFTAPHRTQDFEYYLGDRRVAVFDGGGQQPPSPLSHTVDLGDVAGRQKLLAVWNIADTPNAFYACVDLQVG